VGGKGRPGSNHFREPRYPSEEDHFIGLIEAHVHVWRKQFEEGLVREPERSYRERSRYGT
jgi:hypothetical protein